MGVRKARKPGCDGLDRRPHGSTKAKAGELKRPEANSSDLSCLAIYDGQRCAGFLLPRGKAGVEVFDADDRSLGIFPDLKTAADAVSRARPLPVVVP